jgi:hypothetical protein
MHDLIRMVLVLVPFSLGFLMPIDSQPSEELSEYRVIGLEMFCADPELPRTETSTQVARRAACRECISSLVACFIVSGQTAGAGLLDF